jgi:hypothetical protein
VQAQSPGYVPLKTGDTEAHIGGIPQLDQGDCDRSDNQAAYQYQPFATIHLITPSHNTVLCIKLLFFIFATVLFIPPGNIKNNNFFDQSNKKTPLRIRRFK